MPVRYQNYLRLDTLLSLQTPLSTGPEHDELLFITIHQVYELWFKQVLHELGFIQRAMDTNDGVAVMHGFKRVLSILKTLVAQIDILETMTPISFNSFRDRLETASGFQSVQFRALEITLGKRNQQSLEHYREDQPSYERLCAAMKQPSMWDTFLKFLASNGCNVPIDLLKRDVAHTPEPSELLQTELIALYRSRSPLTQYCERMVDLDEGIQEWRYRHVKMVERTIGTKMGTGGSSGTAYLRSTLFQPLFADLWEIRGSL